MENPMDRTPENLRKCLLGEVHFRTSRASGPGGQHVNKTETRVELTWEPAASLCLDEEQKNRVVLRLSSRLTQQGKLIITGDRFRSQYRNKEELTERFLQLVLSSMIRPKKRFSTRPTRSSQEKRIRGKKIRGELKRLRRIDPGE
jgi:ribosome-associated protein